MKRTFQMPDQLAFAELSGDFNPLHVDAKEARRLLFGKPVVHGIHTLLWALDGWLGRLGREAHPLEITRLDAAFLQPVLVGDEATLRLPETPGLSAELEVLVEGKLCTKIVVEVRAVEASSVVVPQESLPPASQPQEHSAETLRETSGELELYCELGRLRERFANLAQSLSAAQIGSLLASTRLVGTRCPGLHSLYSELQLERQATLDRSTLGYTVTRADARVGLVLLSLEAPGLVGKIKAFLRPRAVQQAGFAELAKLVGEGEFARQRALVVGGSRGLGEVTAKLLAAGGASVHISYVEGADEAQAIADEISGSGGDARTLRLDVLEPSDPALWKQLAPTHIYYFATPRVVGSHQAPFARELFDRFCDYYLHGLVNLVERAPAPGSLHVLYPSSVFVDEVPPGMAEYAAAKAAGEYLARHLEKKYPGLRILCPRLPRLATDQTASIVPRKREDPAGYVLAALRALAAGSQALPA